MQKKKNTASSFTSFISSKNGSNNDSVKIAELGEITIMQKPFSLTI